MGDGVIGRTCASTPRLLDSSTRTGLLGQWDQLVGPGATAVENLGSVGFGIVGVVIGYRGSEGAGARVSKRLLAALIGADLFGGVWANATPTARWWYHGRGQGLPEALAFSAAHLHPFLVAALWRERDWRFAWGAYAYLQAATAVIASAPVRYRLPVALGLYTGSLWLNEAVWKPTPGLGWFAPVFFLKLLISHAALPPVKLEHG